MPHKGLWVNGDATQEVKYVPGDYKVEAGDLLLKTICVAVNPGDYGHPEKFGAINTIEGFDAVGEIVEIGDGVTGFKVGQKVLTFTRGIGPAKYGASQEYFLALAASSWLFDEERMSEEQAATIPLTLCTACDGLYNKMRPPLPLPWSGTRCDWPILLWGASSQVGIQAIQFAKFSGCSPIIVTASPKQHQYLRSLGADVVLDYKDKSVVDKIRNTIPDNKTLRHAFACVDLDIAPIETVVEEGGSISLALPPTRPSPKHHVEMVTAGIIHDQEDFNAPGFNFVGGVEPRDTAGGKTLSDLMVWTLAEAGKKYQLPRVRRLSGRGLYDALEAYELMRKNEISAEKVVWRMEETPALESAA
ncbi:hypothetical protein V496_02587 [Pseudogymnoascus sp. VKM F-4515 (FW-2607)]|nr:hypothetical protein V496_02587 [Pseudogymnoascus sp. VKM F-4515 (FW-2607)]KFY93842.1 hypothetical protein V498_04226 [Pseudogymnoascus sp. VKM F-4517 (FW-2822)]